jgi:hypothetical protein
MKGRHVDARQGEQHELHSKLKILRVADRVRGEQHAAGQYSECKGGPGERQHIGRHGGDAAVGGCNAQQSQVDDRNRADDERDRENVHALDPRKEHAAFANGGGKRRLAQPDEELGSIHAVRSN